MQQPTGTQEAGPQEAGERAEVQREDVGHGVAIRRRGGDVAVVIPVSFAAGEDQSAATVLARAWALLAEAIAENKHKGGQPGTSAAGPDDAPHAAPGSGAWWDG